MFGSTVDLIWVAVMFCVGSLFGMGLRHARKNQSTPYGWIVAITATALIGTICLFSSFNDVKTEGVVKESNLNKQEMQEQNAFSSYINGFYEKLGVANLQSAKVNQILVSAVSAQTDLHSWKDTNHSPLFSALVEAYPQINTAQYQDVLAYIEQGRKGLQDTESQMLNQLNDYDIWRNSEIIFHPLQVKLFGFPDNNLHVVVGSKVLTGAAAEEQMWNIVRNPEVVAAFASGRQGPLAVPNN